MTDPDRGLSSMSEGKKIKIRFFGKLLLEEREIKRKIDRFSVKMAIFRGKMDTSSQVKPTCRREKKLRWLLFFLVGHNFRTKEGLSSVEYNESCLVVATS